MPAIEADRSHSEAHYPLRMLRRLSLSAALAALTVPVLVGGLLAGPAQADPRRDPAPAASDDPAALLQASKQQRVAPARKQVVSRRANRAKAADDAPLAITIDQLTPSAIPDRGMVRISGFVTNNDTTTWSTINVRPFISATPLTDPAQLAEAATLPADQVVGDRISDERYKYFIEELAPGDSAPYSIAVPRSALGVSTPGVYWFGVHALGEGPEGRDDFTDGRARTFLPLVPDARPGQEQAAVVIPLRHQLVYQDDGSLDDLAAWTQTLKPDGRLRSLVDFGASSGDRTVSWVVDPALIDAVRRLARGNPPRSLEPNLDPGQDDGEDTGDGEGGQTDGSGASADPSSSDAATEDPAPTADPEAEPDSPLDLDALDPVVKAAASAAQAWLARLGAAMRPEDEVLTLPYGDVDVAAAAAHDPSLYQRAVARAGTSLPGFDVTTTPVVSSPSGYLSTQALSATDPDTTVLLTDAMFAAPAPAVADTDGHRVVVTSEGAAAGGPGPDSRTALVAMRQRLLAEAAVRFLRGDQAPVTMMLPHDWNPAGGGSFFSGLDADWLDLTSVGAVARTGTPRTVAGTTLRYPRWQQAAELDQPNFASADALIRSGASLQSLLTLNNVVSGTVADQALGTTSYSARTKPIINRASADQSRTWIDGKLREVSVSVSGKAVTLSSSSGRFQATVTNDLDQPVTVALDAEADGGVAIDGPRRVEIPAGGRQAVLLTARTDENGIHKVTLLVTDKRGTPLGGSTALTVRSAQVSNVIWLFLGTGMALLFGAIGVRLFRRVRGARRAPAGADDAAATGTQREPAEAGLR